MYDLRRGYEVTIDNPLLKIATNSAIDQSPGRQENRDTMTEAYGLAATTSVTHCTTSDWTAA